MGPCERGEYPMRCATLTSTKSLITAYILTLWGRIKPFVILYRGLRYLEVPLYLPWGQALQSRTDFPGVSSYETYEPFGHLLHPWATRPRVSE